MGDDGQERTLQRTRRSHGINRITAGHSGVTQRLEGRTARNAAPVDPAIGTTHYGPQHLRAFDRDPIRGGHYGQRSCVPRKTGRTHGCPDQRSKVKILLANPEPSTHWAQSRDHRWHSQCPLSGNGLFSRSDRHWARIRTSAQTRKALRQARQKLWRKGLAEMMDRASGSQRRAR
jgi:hypothetical protein